MLAKQALHCLQFPLANAWLGAAAPCVCTASRAFGSQQQVWHAHVYVMDMVCRMKLLQWPYVVNRASSYTSSSSMVHPQSMLPCLALNTSTFLHYPHQLTVTTNELCLCCFKNNVCTRMQQQVSAVVVPHDSPMHLAVWLWQLVLPLCFRAASNSSFLQTFRLWCQHWPVPVHPCRTQQAAMQTAFCPSRSRCSLRGEKCSTRRSWKAMCLAGEARCSGVV
jgi:hypothetical protein